MARLAITIEGGLISSDLVEQIAATPRDVPGQRSADFGLDARLSDEIQKAFSEALIHWNAFNARTARGQVSATTITRETWVLPLLEELGFTLAFQRAAATAGGGTFMISHRLGLDPEAPPVHVVSCEQELDRRGDAVRSPHALVQDFLNRSDVLWGIVTNGMKLRLLRNTVRFSKPSYIEFDLEAIFKGNLYSEFVLFYRLTHATRLPRSAGDAHESWLEMYYRQGIDQGGRVRERLRDGVQQALEILGTGLLAHPESGSLRAKFENRRLTKIGYYRQLLRLIYRLLFLMVAEERRLLFVRNSENADRQAIYDRWYSIERLRKRSDNHFLDDGHSDLWEGLKHTFFLFEDTNSASQLGLTALDGELFGRFATADLIDTDREVGPKLRNDRLLLAIWHLSTFEDADGRRRRGAIRRRVNFGGLDVEELGSVYESLLDYYPDLTIDGERSKFELIAGTERKSTGSYYTPPELVRELIKSALEPVIEGRLAKAKTRDEKERALLSLKICDPASGSGHFMLAAARRLGRELARVRSGEVEPNPADYRHAVRDVIRRCIYAVDKNPLAVDLCKVALWIEGHEAGLPLSFLDHHVKCGDSLVGVLDLKVLEAGIPEDAYKAVAGDDKNVAAEIKKRNKDEAQQDTLFRHSVQQDIAHIACEFDAIADLPETSPDQVRAKEAAYKALHQSVTWAKAKWACDLGAAAFFALLTKDGLAAVPTTHNVWGAIGGRLPQGRVAATSTNLASLQHFFHWPLEFPEVFAQGGFSVVLGNPPWDVAQIDDKQFFRSRAPDIASLSAAKRKTAIAKLANTNPELWTAYQDALRHSDKLNHYVHASRRFPLTSVGKINLYSLFTELSTVIVSEDGRIGIIVQSGILTDPTNQRFYERIIEDQNLISFHDIVNTEGIFPGIHRSHPHFCLLTIAGRSSGKPASVSFFNTNMTHLQDERRKFELTGELLRLCNPNTHACPAFRSKADASLTRKIYSEHPILLGESVSDHDPWEFVAIQNCFSHTTDDELFLSAPEIESQGAARHGNIYIRAKDGATWLPLYEGKMVNQYDHRFGSFEGREKERGNRNLPETNIQFYQDSAYEPQPYSWVARNEIIDRLRRRNWEQHWLIVWKDITTAVTDRTVNAAVIPLAATDDTLSIAVVGQKHVPRTLCFLANLNSMVLDFVARQKVAGLHLRRNIFIQLPIFPPQYYSERDVQFIQSRSLELSYSSNALAALAKSFKADGQPPQWNPEQRANLSAELDAYYAYLYGLTRRELDYILDPKAVMGEDYPSETFRVLKEDEIKEFREYRTRRLILEAWDRFVLDGTFDPARLREPQYIDRVAQELTATRARLEQIEHDSKALLTFASATPKPTLFVEGITDAKIIEAAWDVFFPSEPMPVKVIAAGGTKEMGSLAGKGKALRELLGNQIVLVLADNDSAGRQLTEDGHVRKGGNWRQLPNGIHWCLLKPTAAFAAAMKSHNVPTDYWPFTIEAAFPPALRRQAEATGAWQFSGTPQAELLDNPDLARRLFMVVPKLGPDDDAYWYLMAPHPDAKEAFAAWVTDPKRRTEENYAAFEEVIRGLRAVLTRDDSEPATRVRGAA
jgi:hypothetical protein